MGPVFRSRDQYWPIRGPDKVVIDQSEAGKCRELITHLSLVSSAPGSRVEFWQNIQTNSDMPTVIRDYFIHIGDNLTQGCDATRFTEWVGDTIIHYHCCIPPLCHCLGCSYVHRPSVPSPQSPGPCHKLSQHWLMSRLLMHCGKLRGSRQTSILGAKISIVLWRFLSIMSRCRGV